MLNAVRIAEPVRAVPGVDLIRELRTQVALRGDAEAIRFLERGEIDGPQASLSYAELDRAARSWAARLQRELTPGDRALLLHPQGIELVVSLLACFYAGVVPVVCPGVPKANLARKLDRLRAVARDCAPACVIAEPELCARRDDMIAHAPELAKVTWVELDDTLPCHPSTWQPARVRSDTPVFLQYSSGSTGDPKGVVVTHANAVEESAMAARAMLRDRPTAVIWTPLFHDMGLATLLYVLLYGGRAVLFSAAAFSQRPLRWLRAIEHFRAECSGAPNFAFELCIRQVSTDEAKRLDLSHWQHAFCGAEPVRAETLRRFAAHFEPAGFRAAALAPAYGLAEATCLVSMATHTSGSYRTIRVARDALESGVGTRMRPLAVGTRAAAEHAELVSVGWTDRDQQIRIVDPQTRRELPPGHLGEVWLQGGNVGLGYWQRPELSRRTFDNTLGGHAGSWLRTGDLGFVHEGALFVAGRLKELIVIRGRNFYPHDFERAAELAHPMICIGGVAAVAIEEYWGESLGLVVEVDARRLRHASDDALECVCGAARLSIASAFQVEPSRVALVRGGELLRTTSGKLRRTELRRNLMDPRTRWLHSWRAPGLGDSDSGAHLARVRLLERATAEGMSLVEAIEQLLTTSLSIPRVDVCLTDLPVDSLRLVSLRAQIEDALELELPMAELFEQWQRSTPAQLARYLAEAWRKSHADDGAHDVPVASRVVDASAVEEFVI